MFRDTEEFKRGRSGEQLVSSILRSRGWYIIPSYDYSGEGGDKAPRMHGARLAFVLPDLDIARQGDRRWIEVKTKGSATLYRKTGTLEHGISASHLAQYRRVEAETGCQVWIFVFEESTREILFQLLTDLGEPRIYGGPKMGRHGMAFWPRTKFRLFCRIDEDVAA